SDKAVVGPEALLRGDQGLRDFHADLAIIPDGAGMERQEVVFIDVLRNRLICGGMGLYKPGLIVEDDLDEVMYQIFGKIGARDRKIVHSQRDVILVEGAISGGLDC